MTTSSKLQQILEQSRLTPEQILQVREHASIKADHPVHIMLVEGWLSRRDLKSIVTEELKFEYVDLVGKKIDRSVATLLKPTFVMREQVLPIAKSDSTLTVAMLDPTDEALCRQIAEQTQCSVHPVFTLDLDINWQFHELFGKTLVHKSVYNLFWQSPDASAALILTPSQIYAAILLAGLFLLALTLEPFTTLLAVSAAINSFYLFAVMFKFMIALVGSRYELVEHVSRHEVRALKDEELPIYTILVPLFKEANVLPKLAAGLSRLNYPKQKLDVRLLLEQDDTETIDAIKELPQPAMFDFAVVPNFGPRTKPKACNYGLFLAKGRIVTIYDAEDIPDPDQLKKVVALFRKETPDVVCIQAALNYYNSNENLLTRMFTLEYSYWFDYMLRGLQRLGIPIPLGGTSNHFRVDKLRELGGWDPFNVTEDADLGVRASVRGFRIALVDSTTYEEANRAYGNWIRQRSRWIKGYVQTWLVHMRHPIRLLRTLGWKGFLGFNFFIGGTPFTFLVNPILWILFLLWLFLRMKWLDIFFPPLLLYFSLSTLLLGNLIMIYMNMLAVFKRRIFSLTIYALLNPVYWILHSIASYKALWQLLRKPFFWEKTRHGLSKIELASMTHH